jgi:hypothetical protein
VGDRVYPIRPPPCSSTVCLTDPLAPPVLVAPSSLDLVPPPPIAPPTLNRSSSSTSLDAAQRLGPAVESQDPGAWPLLDGAAKRVNRQSTRLPHGLNRSCGVPEPDEPSSVDGSANGDGGRGAARASEVGEGSDDWLCPRCQWPLESAPWTNGDTRHPMDHRHPNGAGDYCDSMLVNFFFSSLLLPLIAR